MNAPVQGYRFNTRYVFQLGEDKWLMRAWLPSCWHGICVPDQRFIFLTANTYLQNILSIVSSLPRCWEQDQLKIQKKKSSWLVTRKHNLPGLFITLFITE